MHCENRQNLRIASTPQALYTYLKLLILCYLDLVSESNMFYEPGKTDHGLSHDPFKVSFTPWNERLALSRLTLP